MRLCLRNLFFQPISRGKGTMFDFNMRSHKTNCAKAKADIFTHKKKRKPSERACTPRPPSS